MKDFPNKIHVDNKDNFKQINYDRNLCYLRKSVYEHVIAEDENTYFELDAWCRKYIKNDWNMMESMILTIIDELQKQGWKCKTSFNNTGLFVYSSEKPPSSCFEDLL